MACSKIKALEAEQGLFGGKEWLCLEGRRERETAGKKKWKKKRSKSKKIKIKINGLRKN